MRAFVRACVRGCVRACVRARMRACGWMDEMISKDGRRISNGSFNKHLSWLKKCGSLRRFFLLRLLLITKVNTII